MCGSSDLRMRMCETLEVFEIQLDDDSHDRILDCLEMVFMEGAEEALTDEEFAEDVRANMTVCETPEV